MAYDQLNPLAELGVLYGTAPTQMVPTGEQDPNALINELLRSLPQEPTPQMQQPKTWQNVLGGLSDALLQYSTVRGGGPPMPTGPYAARRISNQQQQAQMAREAERQNRETERRVRIGAFEESLRANREKETAMARNRGWKPQIRSIQTKNERGEPIEVPYVFDANSQTLTPVSGYEQGFEKYVKPMLAQGINQETGEMEFRMLNPLDFTGGGKVGGLEPKPTQGEAESAESVNVVIEQLRDFKNAASTYGGGTAGTLTQTAIRAIPGGTNITETFGNPDFERLAAIRQRIGRQMARLVENGRLSDYDVESVMEILPTITSLTTETGRKSFAQKVALAEKEIQTRIARKTRIRPGLLGGGGGSPEAPQQPRQDLSGMGMPRSKFNTYPPEIQQEIMDSGVQIIEGQ